MRDDKTQLAGLTRYRFGDRWQFAIECELRDCELDPWGSKEPFGSFWMWVGGRVVGNTHVEEQLVHAFLPLAQSVRRAGNRADGRFKGMTNLDKLNLVGWIRFGEDKEFDGARWGAPDRDELRREDLTRYEVVPRGYSPYSDGWEAILVEQDEMETFIWRRQGDVAEVHEFALPRGLFTQVATRAVKWFERTRLKRLGSDKAVTDEKVRLAKPGAA
jgi:hypothetical protein